MIRIKLIIECKKSLLKLIWAKKVIRCHMNYLVASNKEYLLLELY